MAKEGMNEESGEASHEPNVDWRWDHMVKERVCWIDRRLWDTKT